MARCDEGYRCEVCGLDVEHIQDSDLYLRYVLGEVPLERLHLSPERHIRCHPAMAQYIAHAEFPAVVLESLFGKQYLDADYVASQTRRVTQAWLRLRAIRKLGLALPEYPLDVTPFSPQEE